MEVRVTHLDSLTPSLLAPLLVESEQEGWRFVRRLADEWTAASNRFDRPGEQLFAAWSGNVLVGICGLNIDPYAADPTVGRVRRLYVAREARGCGVGAALVRAILQAARGHFRMLRVRTENAAASRLYERLGFAAVVSITDCTHVLTLGPEA
jgi:GNAT superfamily N-acetyltransferase